MKSSEANIWPRVVLLACSLFLLYYITYTIHPSFGTFYSNFSIWPEQPTRLSTESFQQQWLETQLLDPFDPTPIQAYCNQTKWRPKLIFNLSGAGGGVGNVRAEILDFIFYAIEAGASIIVPSMAKRNDDVLFDIWGAGKTNFSSMFDPGWFKSSLSDACPQMRVYDSGDEEIQITGKREGEARHVEGVYDPRSPLARRHSSKADWLATTNTWLEAMNVVDTQLSIVEVDRTMWEVDTRKTPTGFRVNFPVILRANPDIRLFAGAAMAGMAEKYGLDLHPSDHFHPNAFFGAHLRTESDTIDAGWQTPCSATECGLNWTTQTDVYIQHAMQNNLSVIYTASGNATEIERFRVKAAANDPPLTVVDKWDLLSESEAESLQALRWDQQAIVDLEILNRCSVFGGMAKSSFSFMIAVARSTWLEESGFVMDPWAAKKLDLMVTYEDGLSKIWGRNQLNEERVPKGMWP